MDPVVVIGLGQLGQIFGAGFLRLGIPVIPIIRTTNQTILAEEVPSPRLVLVATGEDDLVPVLDAMPVPWKNRVGLIQNELVPATWQNAGIFDPTVVVVWFEKKAGQAHRELVASPIYGPASELIAKALGTLDISSTVVKNADALRFELVLKNVYILTTNIAGLVVGGTVGDLWSTRRTLAYMIMQEVLLIQEALTQSQYAWDDVVAGLDRVIGADPGHQCRGRTAPLRLKRLLVQARELNRSLPICESVDALQEKPKN